MHGAMSPVPYQAAAHEHVPEGHILESLAHQISHELRTPLNAVIGFSDMMRQELFGPVGSTRYREYLEHISENAQRMLQAAEETLSLTSELVAPRPASSAKPFNLSAATAQAVMRAAEDAGRAPSAIDVQIGHSIEVWGCDETTIAALIYLFRACLLHAPERTATLVSTTRKNRDVMLLTITIKDTGKDIGNSHQGNHGAAPVSHPSESADAALFKGLAVALFKHQGSHVDSISCDTAGETISVELELSAQQAFLL